MKSRNFPILILFCFFFAQVGTAQQITTNENGEKIIVYPNGSWEYAKDTEETSATPQRSISTDTPEKETDQDLELAVQIADMAAAAESEAIRQEEDAKYKRLLLEDDLKEAEGSDEYFAGELKAMKAQLKAAKKAEKKAKSLRKAAAKRANSAAELVTMDPASRAEALKKYRKEEPAIVREEVMEEEPVEMFPGTIEKEKTTAPVVIAPRPPTRTARPATPRTKKTFAKYDPSKDVMFNPPREDCQLSFDGMDEFSGKKRKDVQKQLFFTHTNEEIRSIFKDKDYITCTGYLSALSGGLKFLTLNITIASKTAQREYGILEKGGQINIKLINGENVKLINTKTNMGTENPLEGSVTYRAQYVVSSGDEKKLKKSEVDKVRIIWSSGYEDYEIYELDFFIDQFKCL